VPWFFFLILITVRITFISHRTKCAVLLAFLRAFCPHVSIKRYMKNALLQVCVRFEVLQWRLSPRWVSLYSTALPVGPSSFPAHVTSVIRQTAGSRSRVVITPYLRGPGFKSHPKARLTEFLWFPPFLQANAAYPMTGSFHIPVFLPPYYHSTLYTPIYL
jgi:hypothetical protein